MLPLPSLKVLTAVTLCQSSTHRLPKWQEEDSIIAHPYNIYSLSIEIEVIEESTHCVHDHTLIFEHNTLDRETLANIRRNTALTALMTSIV